MKEFLFLVFVNLLSLFVFGFVSAQTTNTNISGLPVGPTSSADDSGLAMQCSPFVGQDYQNCIQNLKNRCQTLTHKDADTQTKKRADCVKSLNSCLDGGGQLSRCICKAIGGISLNTNVPFIGNCISLTPSSSSDTTAVTPTTAFPRLLAGLTRIVMTVILIFCFMAIIIGGVLISMGGASEEQAKKGKDLIKHVVMALALLGASGVILRVINPSFFG